MNSWKTILYCMHTFQYKKLSTNVIFPFLANDRRGKWNCTGSFPPTPIQVVPHYPLGFCSRTPDGFFKNQWIPNWGKIASRLFAFLLPPQNVLIKTLYCIQPLEGWIMQCKGCQSKCRILVFYLLVTSHLKVDLGISHKSDTKSVDTKCFFFENWRSKLIS